VGDLVDAQYYYIGLILPVKLADNLAENVSHVRDIPTAA
jgi:hypothetical protein